MKNLHLLQTFYLNIFCTTSIQTLSFYIYIHTHTHTIPLSLSIIFLFLSKKYWNYKTAIGWQWTKKKKNPALFSFVLPLKLNLVKHNPVTFYYYNIHRAKWKQYVFNHVISSVTQCPACVLTHVDCPASFNSQFSCLKERTVRTSWTKEEPFHTSCSLPTHSSWHLNYAHGMLGCFTTAGHTESGLYIWANQNYPQHNQLKVLFALSSVFHSLTVEQTNCASQRWTLTPGREMIKEKYKR